MKQRIARYKILRGVSLDDAQWVFGDLGYVAEGLSNWRSQMPCGTEFSPWLQYTGHTDRNRRDVYEGDIVKSRKYLGGNYIEHIVERFEVCWRPLECAFALKPIPSADYTVLLDMGPDATIEVIGNIYQHPELLK